MGFNSAFKGLMANFFENVVFFFRKTKVRDAYRKAKLFFLNALMRKIHQLNL